ncbi:hypothetical protein Barb6XT_03007 [Bacteroidales bacterium Barb6XT]|nr:hypothetical protein Barb6XT_03007 [Bacteroidales bacterium Barb6XT]
MPNAVIPIIGKVTGISFLQTGIFRQKQKHLPLRDTTVGGRHYPARFKRKGKCCSKAEHMIEKSLNLLFLKLNSHISLLNILAIRQFLFRPYALLQILSILGVSKLKNLLVP